MVLNIPAAVVAATLAHDELHLPACAYSGYRSLPPVPLTGPLNIHFVRDIGAAADPRRGEDHEVPSRYHPGHPPGNLRFEIGRMHEDVSILVFDAGGERIDRLCAVRNPCKRTGVSGWRPSAPGQPDRAGSIFTGSGLVMPGCENLRRSRLRAHSQDAVAPVKRLEEARHDRDQDRHQSFRRYQLPEAARRGQSSGR